MKEEFFGDRSYVKKIEKKVTERTAFKLSKQLISEDLKSKQINKHLDNATLRDLRSITMSFIPEADQKIYTFTFRSELSSHNGNISFVIGLLGLMFTIFKNC